MYLTKFLVDREGNIVARFGPAKKPEEKGLISRERSDRDERCLSVAPTERGMQLRDLAVEVPEKMGGCISLSEEEMGTLYQLLYKVLGDFAE